MGIVNNNTFKTDSKPINFGEYHYLLRINLNIKESKQNLLYQIIDLNFEDSSKNIRFYNSEYLDKPINISDCENQNINYIHS